jgi:hypothetical protein
LATREASVVNDIIVRGSTTAVTGGYPLFDAPPAYRPAFIYFSTSNLEKYTAASFEDYSINWTDYSFDFLAED